MFQSGDATTIFEALEPRVLLSSVPTAAPLFRLYYPAGSAKPADSTSPVGLTPAQIRHAYGIDVTTFGTIVGDGAGQTIAIVDAYDAPTIVSDVQIFCSTFNLSACNLVRINQTGGSTLPGTDPNGPGNSWALETSLDVEWAHAVAPQATILLVEANSSSYVDLFTAVGTAAAYPGVSVVSMSWGGPEFSTEATYDHYMTTPTGHAGVTFLTASGDNGAYVSRRTLGVDYPPASPNVIAVGGTLLNVDAGGNYISESGWGYGTSSYRSGGSGGGIARYENQPPYQNGVVSAFSTTRRTAPDVAFDADPTSGVAVYDSWDDPALPWAQVGGTSLASPAWAGIIAIVNQGRALESLSPMSNQEALTKLYALPASNFRDITSGSNGPSPTYAARPGYDLVTGLGTPIVNRLAPAMAGTPVDVPPVLAGIEASALAYTENDPATVVTGTLVASDVDNTTLAGATVRITGNYQGSQDVLAFIDTATITGSWNATTGTLALSGSDTVANYQAALRAVTYRNTAEAPSPLARTVSFTVSDGLAGSNTVTRNISITDTTTFWTGAYDTHWETAANWSNSVLPGSAVTAVFADEPHVWRPVLYGNQTALGLDVRSAGWTVDVNGWTLSVGTGGLALPGGNTPTSRIQLGSGNLVVAYTGASPLTSILAWIEAGGGTKSNAANYDWNGTGGITSSAAAGNNRDTSLGLRDNGYALINRPAMTDLNGVPVPAEAIVIRYTWMGDMDLDGTVTVNDYLEWLNYYDTPPTMDEIAWATGDFNYDGHINVNDYLILLAGYANQSGPLASGSAATTVTATAATPASSDGGSATLTVRPAAHVARTGRAPMKIADTKRA